MPVLKVRSESEFDSTLNKSGDKLIIVDFTATWCGPCQKIAPIFEQLSDKYRQCVFLKVDVDDQQDIAQAYEVRAMPTFVFLKTTREVDRLRGADPEGLENKIKELAGPANSFSGEGQRLGGTLSSTPPLSTTPEIVNSSSLDKAQTLMNVNESQPGAKVNIRLADGSRLTVTLNLTQPISRIREFICAARPDQSARSFSLMTTFPSKELMDENISINDAKLANAVVVQKMK